MRCNGTDDKGRQGWRICCPGPLIVELRRVASDELEVVGGSAYFLKRGIGQISSKAGKFCACRSDGQPSIVG